MNFFPTKKELLKPLLLSDVIVSLINQQHSMDRLSIYKHHLSETEPDVPIETCQSSSFLLPEFAEKEWSELQLLSYHLGSGSFEHFKHYDYLLQAVEHRLQQLIGSSYHTIATSESTIQQLRQTVFQLYATVSAKRGLMKHLRANWALPHAILKKTRKIANITKTIDIMRVWNKGHLSQILSLNVAHIHKHKDIEGVLASIEEAISVFSTDPPQEREENIKSALRGKMQLITSQIQKNMEESVIEFQHEQDYQRKCEQYRIARDPQQLDLLGEKGISTLITLNLDSLFKAAFSGYNSSSFGSINFLNEVQFEAFVSNLVAKFLTYIVNWHRTTSFHIGSNTPHQHQFISKRAQLHGKIVAKVAEVLQHSQKFTHFAFKYRVKISQKCYDFLTEAEEWLGKCKLHTTFREILRSKFKEGDDNQRKIVYSSLKNALAEELKPQSDIIHGNFSSQLTEIIMNFKCEVNLEKIFLLFKTDGSTDISVQQSTSKEVDCEQVNSQKTTSGQPTVSTLKQLLAMSPHEFPAVTSPVAQKLLLLIYSEAIHEQYFSDRLGNIYQSFQFVLYIIHSICDTPKDSSICDRFLAAKGDRQAEDSVPLLNQYMRYTQHNTQHAQLDAFMQHTRKVFAGLSLHPYSHIMKIYAEGLEKDMQAFLFKLIPLFDQLHKIIQFVTFLLPRYFSKEPQKIIKKVEELCQITEKMLNHAVEPYFMLLDGRFTQTMLPHFMSIKWEIKKFSNETASSSKDCRSKIIEFYEGRSLMVKKVSREMQLRVFSVQSRWLFGAVLELYTRMEKVNDNGRQLVRLDTLQIAKAVNAQNPQRESASEEWFDWYMEAISERSVKVLLQKIEQKALLYPVQLWKSNLVWLHTDMSARERKEYWAKVIRIYFDQLTNRYPQHHP